MGDNSKLLLEGTHVLWAHKKPRPCQRMPKRDFCTVEPCTLVSSSKQCHWRSVSKGSTPHSIFFCRAVEWGSTDKQFPLSLQPTAQDTGYLSDHHCCTKKSSQHCEDDQIFVEHTQAVRLSQCLCSTQATQFSKQATEQKNKTKQKRHKVIN